MARTNTIVCQDGFRMSAQELGRALVEVGRPSEPDELLTPFADDPEDLLNALYPYVPASVVRGVIAKHGGLIEGDLPTLKRTKTAKRTNTIKLYEGPSQWDNLTTIIVLLTGLAKSSKNTKTGDMLQTWILLKDTPPHEAVKTGADEAICGLCPLRPTLFRRVLGAITKFFRLLKPCYVKTFQAPLSTWKANKDLPVTPPDIARALIGSRVVRRGSYGDPAMVPPHVWDNLRDSPGTGYSHQWERFPHFAPFVMASVHTEEERSEARALGFRTFRILNSVDDLGLGEILCPASKEAGARVQCADCNLCNGSKGTHEFRKDIAIVAH